MSIVSVIIPLYNKQDYIEACVESVLNQTFQDFEIIIINDGSTDNSRQVINKYKDNPKIVVVDQENSGASVARNKGIELAEGKYIAFLDADDEWVIEKLSKQVEFLEKNSDVYWCSTNVLIKNTVTGMELVPENNQIFYEKDWIKVLDWFETSIYGPIVFTPAVMIKKNVFDKVGVFDENIKAGQDSDLWIRIAKQFPIFGFYSKDLVIVNTALENSISTSGFSKYESMFRYIEKHINDYNALIRSSYKKYMQLKVFIYLKTLLSLGYQELFCRTVRIIPLKVMTFKIFFLIFISLMPYFWVKKLKQLGRKSN